MQSPSLNSLTSRPPLSIRTQRTDMDPTLPQMQSFDFDRLDPIALEDTLAYLRQHPEPPAEDVALFGGYQGLLADAVGEQDWMAEPFQDMGGESRSLQILHGLSEDEPSIVSSSADIESSCTSGSGGSSGLRSHARDGLNATNPSMARRFRQDSCAWEGCPGPRSGVAPRVHLEDHTRHALSRWACPSRCTWQGCKSKSVFKAARQFDIHLENIHTNPLVCTRSHCPHKKPFRNKHELGRHDSTKHSTQRPWECPYDSCTLEIRTFARKDKWLQHIQEKQHENDAFCPFYHCRFGQVRAGKAFENRKEIGQHFSFNSIHVAGGIDGYACGLGSCAITANQDRWDLWGFFGHLTEMHKISTFLLELEGILQGTDRILRIQHVPVQCMDEWVDCEACASQLEAQSLLSTATEHANLSNAAYL